MTFIKKNLIKKPKIAITGLNPHCESNYKISEEERIINLLLNIKKKKNLMIDGPFPADTIFIKDVSKKYDVLIGMYHDQVLNSHEDFIWI